MRAVWYERTGPAREVLIAGEMPTPAPLHGEVLVKIVASGVNPHDTKSRSGWTGRPMGQPRIVPHSDGAGVIVGVGPGVAERRVGERVWISRADHRPGMGAAADYAVVSEDCAVPLPKDVAFATGAGIGIPALTAYAAVFAGGPVTGMDVLVQGGAGAVAAYAIQFARWNGARVFATVSSPEKAEHARRYGADAVIDYRREDVAERMLALTDGRGVDRIAEVDFGANLKADIRVIKPHGWIASYSSSRVREPILPYYELAPKDVTIRIVQGRILTSSTRAAAVAPIGHLMERGALLHPPATIFPFSDVAGAHLALESGSIIGKVIVEGPDGLDFND
jgi:NADPH:quinone reductase-like Zn-dependent oxidoreductase